MFGITNTLMSFMIHVNQMSFKTKNYVVEGIVSQYQSPWLRTKSGSLLVQLALQRQRNFISLSFYWNLRCLKSTAVICTVNSSTIHLIFFHLHFTRERKLRIVADDQTGLQGEIELFTLLRARRFHCVLFNGAAWKKYKYWAHYSNTACELKLWLGR